MIRSAIVALCLWSTAALAETRGVVPIDTPVKPAEAEVWIGLEIDDAGLAPLPRPAKLATTDKRARKVKDDATKTYTFEQPLFSVEKLEFVDADKKPIAATARPTNLFLLVNPKTKATRIVARDGEKLREIKVYAPGTYKESSFTAASVAVAGAPISVPVEIPAIATTKPDTGKLSDFEKTVLRPKMLKEEERKTCADDAPIAKCRDLFKHVLGLAGKDPIAQEAYLEQRIGGADYKDFYAKARDAVPAADKAKFFEPWHAAIAAEFKAYLASPAAFDPKKVDPKKEPGPGIEVLLERLKHAQRMKARRPTGPLADDLVKLLGAEGDSCHKQPAYCEAANNEAAVIAAYYKNAKTTDEGPATIRLAAAGNPEAKSKFEQIRNEVAAKTRDFLGAEQRDASSPFASLSDDVLLDHYCGAVGHARANAMTQAAADAKLQSMKQAVNAALCGTTMDGKACASPAERADQRCATHMKPHGPKPDPTTQDPPQRTTDLKGFVPGPVGAPVAPAGDKSDKLNIYNGIKGAIMGAIIGGILLGPAGLLLGAAVLGFAGWYMSKDANEK